MLPQYLSCSSHNNSGMLPFISFSTDTKASIHQKLTFLISKFNFDLGNALQAARKDSKQLNARQKKDLRAHEHRLSQYNRAYAYLKYQLEQLIKIKNSQKLIQTDASPALLSSFFESFFCLLELNDCFTKTFANQFSHQYRRNVHESKDDAACPPLMCTSPTNRYVSLKNKLNLKRIVIDIAAADNSSPSVLTPRTPKTPIAGKKSPSLKAAPPAPNQARAYKNIMKQIQFVSTLPPLDEHTGPCLNASAYIVDYWHSTQLVMLYTQLILKEGLSQGSPYRNRDFFLYKDKTIFQGRTSESDGNGRLSARHMNFSPQTYDLITYYVLEKITRSQAITPEEDAFLAMRQLSDDVVGISILHGELIQLLKEATKPLSGMASFQEVFAGFTKLTPEKFIRIASIFARTHVECTANATYEAPSASNKADVIVERMMGPSVERLQHMLLQDTFPLDACRMQTGTAPVQFQGRAERSLSVTTPTLCFRLSAVDHTPAEKDDLPDDLKLNHKKLHRLFSDLKSFYLKGYIWPLAPQEYNAWQLRLTSISYKEFTLLFMQSFCPQGKALSGVVPFSDEQLQSINKILDDWIEENCLADAAHGDTDAHLWPTPQLDKLKTDAHLSDYHSKEYACLSARTIGVEQHLPDLVGKAMSDDASHYLATTLAANPYAGITQIHAATSNIYAEVRAATSKIYEDLTNIYAMASEIPGDVQEIYTAISKIEAAISAIHASTSKIHDATPGVHQEGMQEIYSATSDIHTAILEICVSIENLHPEGVEQIHTTISQISAASEKIHAAISENNLSQRLNHMAVQLLETLEQDTYFVQDYFGGSMPMPASAPVPKSTPTPKAKSKSKQQSPATPATPTIASSSPAAPATPSTATQTQTSTSSTSPAQAAPSSASAAPSSISTPQDEEEELYQISFE